MLKWLSTGETIGHRTFLRTMRMERSYESRAFALNLTRPPNPLPINHDEASIKELE